MATNRIDSLDPALIRPGRIDRKIEFPLPDEKTKRRIFNIHTSKMTLSTCVKVDEYILAKDDLSGADIKAICTEAGLMALRYVLVQLFYPGHIGFLNGPSFRMEISSPPKISPQEEKLGS